VAVFSATLVIGAVSGGEVYVALGGKSFQFQSFRRKNPDFAIANDFNQMTFSLLSLVSGHQKIVIFK
jgi:hypothetical protein